MDNVLQAVPPPNLFFEPAHIVIALFSSFRIMYHTRLESCIWNGLCVCYHYILAQRSGMRVDPAAASIPVDHLIDPRI